VTAVGETALAHLAASDVDGIEAALDRGGACIARDLLPAGLCRTLLDDFAPHLLGRGQDDLGYRDGFYGTRTKRLHGLFGKSSRMVGVFALPETAQRLLDVVPGGFAPYA